VIAATLPMVASASAAMAGSYSGTWKLIVTHAQHANGGYCLTLADNGSLGWRHSGQAALAGARVGGTLPYGTFQLIGHTIIVTIEQPGGTGQNAGLVFTGAAANGSVGSGLYDQVYGGEAADTGAVKFGPKGGC